jgi:uncharacterized membrane-anchored protein
VCYFCAEYTKKMIPFAFCKLNILENILQATYFGKYKLFTKFTYFFFDLPKNLYLADTKPNVKMDKKQGLYLLIGLQLAILIGMFAKAFYPLWAGKEIIFKTAAKDPRDIFRGNYVVLNYDFNRLYLDLIKNNDIDSTTLANFNFGDKLFLELEPEGKYYKTVGIWQKKPQTDNICMQVIVQSRPYGRSIEVKAGVESYFTTTTNAKSLEKATSWAAQDSVEVTVAICVASNGAARIKEVFVKPL